MSDLSMYEFEDILDDLCQSDDHIVPGPVDDHSLFSEGHKKPHSKVTNISYSTEDGSSAGYVDRGSEEGSFSSLSRRNNIMLKKGSRSHAPSGVISSSANGDSIEEASSLASEKITPSSHILENSSTDSHGNELCVDDTVIVDRTTGFDDNSSTDPLGDTTHTDNNLDFFKDAEVKDSSDFLFYDWPEIENFEDVDRIFRSCDSTFGLGASREDELGWFSSSNNIGGTKELVNTDFKFSSPESNSVESLRESPWISDKADSVVSFVNQPGILNGEDGYTPKEQMNEHPKHVKLQKQSVEELKEHNFGNGSLDCTSKLQNEAVQLPSKTESRQAFLQQPQHILASDSCNYLQNCILYAHSDNSPSSDLTSANPTPAAVKTEINELTSPSTRDSSHVLNLLPSMNGSHDPPFSGTAPTGKREKIHNYRGSQSLMDSNIKPADIVVQATSSDPGSVATASQYAGDKSENQSTVEEFRHITPAELGSSNIQESSTSSGIDDVSLEAGSFRQLQRVMEQLDLRTKICIRDSLYRLARSAEQRHTYAGLNMGSGDGRDPSGALITEGEKSFMDIETDTNPIDRSVAHLLFHRPSEPSPTSAQVPLPFKPVSF